VYPRANLRHHPDSIAPQDMGQGRPGGILALGQIAVGGVEGGEVHPQEYLARPGGGLGEFGEL